MNASCANGAPLYMGKSLADATRSSATILMIDEGLTLNDGYFVGGTSDLPSLIHLGGANNLFLDGHVKWKGGTQYLPTDYNY